MAGKKRIQIIGNRYGRLVVIEEIGPGRNYDRIFRCRCDCGKEKDFSMNTLRRGNAASCGCKNEGTLAKMNNELDRIDGILIKGLIREKPSHNTSGVKGVSVEYTKKGKKVYRAYISVGGKKNRLGNFYSKDEAIQARKKAEKLYHDPILRKAETRVKANGGSPER